MLIQFTREKREIIVHNMAFLVGGVHEPLEIYIFNESVHSKFLRRRCLGIYETQNDLCHRLLV